MTWSTYNTILQKLSPDIHLGLLGTYHKIVHSHLGCSFDLGMLLAENCYHMILPSVVLLALLEGTPWHNLVGTQNHQIYRTGTFGSTLEPFEL
jgi:hypothetical protein